MAETVTLTSSQWRAIKAVVAWFRSWDGHQKTFLLFGYAGTGKSTLLPYIMAELGLNTSQVLHAAFTGKASSVMKEKGALNATTIHQLIYRAVEYWAQGRLRYKFHLNPDSILSRARLLVLDECSMVDTKLGEDILSFNVPVLVLGDPGQLPPIAGEGYFTSREPDVLLTDVRRQAKDNPILAASMAVRDDPRVDLRRFADGKRLRVVRASEMTAETFLAADQILVGRNSSRRFLNERLRLRCGQNDIMPVRAGAKLCCVRNKHDLGLMNGMLYHSSEITTAPNQRALISEWERGAANQLDGRERSRSRAILELIGKDPEFFERWRETAISNDANQVLQLGIHIYPFEEDKNGWVTPEQRLRLDIDAIRLLDLVQMTWGWALTVHRAQGSQWNSIAALIDPMPSNARTLSCWLYTLLTRAAEQITIVMPNGD